jgi:hypothetical protein
MDSKKVLSANIKYSAERYGYHLKFNLENIGQYISSLSYDNEFIDDPKFVYKYFGRNTNSLNSLKENYLYFSDPRKFNDPFDCLVNRENYIIANKSNMQKHRDNIGVCSFSVINDNPLMWGHYANCFSGFCIKIKNDFANKKDIAVKSHVAYLEEYNGTNETLKGAINAVNQLDLNNTEKNVIQTALKIAYEYCWKFHDWKYEKEYRAISINALDFERKLSYDKNQVEEIYIGYRMQMYHPTFYKNLMRILKKHYPHIRVYEVRPHPIRVKLEFTKK